MQDCGYVTTNTEGDQQAGSWQPRIQMGIAHELNRNPAASSGSLRYHVQAVQWLAVTSSQPTSANKS